MREAGVGLTGRVTIIPTDDLMGGVVVTNKPQSPARRDPAHDSPLLLQRDQVVKMTPNDADNWAA